MTCWPSRTCAPGTAWSAASGRRRAVLTHLTVVARGPSAAACTGRSGRGDDDALVAAEGDGGGLGARPVRPAVGVHRPHRDLDGVHARVVVAVGAGELDVVRMRLVRRRGGRGRRVAP